MYYHGSFWKNPDFPGTFFLMPNGSSEQVLESGSGIIQENRETCGTFQNGCFFYNKHMIS